MFKGPKRSTRKILRITEKGPVFGAALILHRFTPVMHLMLTFYIKTTGFFPLKHQSAVSGTDVSSCSVAPISIKQICEARR